ncbi:hypothetical protein [Leptotrichia hongkongensis]|jgi:hypothetical protein|uniref:hypothetical protein n=1 Tax=Leptotrichia hongkongensis TaxID=554406 RepID=UPI0035A83B7E
MKKLILGIIVIICCLNAVAKNNEVIKSSSRQVIDDKIDENLEKTLNFSQSNIISSEALKEFKKSSINKEKENNDITSEDTLIPSK